MLVVTDPPASEDVLDEYDAIRNELFLFDSEVGDKPEIVALNKARGSFRTSAPGLLHPTTRPTDPLYKKIRVLGLRSVITLIRRCPPVGGLDGSFELQCVYRTHHSKANFRTQWVRGPPSTLWILLRGQAKLCCSFDSRI